MRRIAALLAGSVLVLVLNGGGTPAFGADPNASCLGIGGSTETALGGPGARADIAHEVIVLAAESGTTPGGEYASFAHEHLGSIDACFG